MRRPLTASFLALLLGLAAAACDEEKPAAKPAPSALPAAVAPVVSAAPAPVVSAAPAPLRIVKKKADCKPSNPVDFSDDPLLEKEVRRKLAKPTEPISPADLANIRSINLTAGKVSFVNPCIFPLFTNLRDLYLGDGDYDDLWPIAGLTNLITVRAALSNVKDLHPLQKLVKLDRLDLSHTKIRNEDLDSLAGLVNITELSLDETQITDLAVVGKMKKLSKLSLKNSAVESLEPLHTLTELKALYIKGSPATNISPLQGLLSTGRLHIDPAK